MARTPIELEFVGGAIVGLLTDEGAEPPRSTLDVDVATHVASRPGGSVAA